MEIGFLEPQTLSAVQAETIRAETLHGKLPNQDRAMVILMEEVGEAAEEILEFGRTHNPNRRDNAVKELIQVASVALRLVEQLEHDSWPVPVNR